MEEILKVIDTFDIIKNIIASSIDDVRSKFMC